jgi:hypothetical protein
LLQKTYITILFGLFETRSWILSYGWT